MIGHNIPETHEQARAELAESVARFLAGGGEIKECTGVGSVPRPPNLRRYREPTPSEPRQAAKALSAACAAGAKRLRAQHKQEVERAAKRRTRADELERLLNMIRAYSHTSLSRSAVAQLLNISPQRLTKLIDEHGIQFPRWRRSE